MVLGDPKLSAVFLAFLYKYTIRSTVSHLVSDSLSDSKSETRCCVQNVELLL